MPAPCSHVPEDQAPPEVAANGCETCLMEGRTDWVHLRFCQTCGRVGCCDNSPGKHARAHHAETGHPLIRSYEPDEHWWWCYEHEVAFNVKGSPPAPSHDGTR